MSKQEVIEHDTLTVAANNAALNSVRVMEQWGGGETYNEDRWIERARQAARKTLEGMFDLGRALIVLKEHTEHGYFREITQKELGLGRMEVTRLMNATRRFATPQMQKAAPKLMELGKSKLLELLVEEDEAIVDLADGGDINGHTLDDIDRMTRNELRAALRESRDTAEAKDKIIADKNKKVDELAEKLAKKQTGKEPSPEDVGSELSMRLVSMTVGIRSDISRLPELFEAMQAHGLAHSFNHEPQMVGCLNQIIMDLEGLRDRYALPNEVPDDDETPEWLRQEGE